MLINFHISLITKRFLRSFDRHSDKTVTLSANCCQTSINSVIKHWFFSESFTNVASKLFELLWYMSWIPLIFSRNAVQWIHTVFLQRIGELSPPSYILYTLLHIVAIWIKNQKMAQNWMQFIMYWQPCSWSTSGGSTRADVDLIN